MKFGATLTTICLVAFSIGASALPTAVNDDVQARGVGGKNAFWKKEADVDARDWSPGREHDFKRDWSPGREHDFKREAAGSVEARDWSPGREHDFKREAAGTVEARENDARDWSSGTSKEWKRTNAA